MPLRKTASLLTAALLSAAGCSTAPKSPPAPPPGADPLVFAAEHRAERLAWWSDARFGMFIHFGLYSEHAGIWPGTPCGRYSEWLISHGIPPEEYRSVLTKRFNPAKFDAAGWVRLAKTAGMKYIVITTKHHEGFALWDSAASDYNAVKNTPFRRDILLELAEACRREGIRLGFYYSVLDWYHPDYLPRRKNPQFPPDNDTRPVAGADFSRYLAFMNAQLAELLGGRYGNIAVLWFDGGWDHDAKGYHSEEAVRNIYAMQPGIIINDRIALPMDFATPEQEVPDRKIPARPWETCMTMNGSWGYKAGDDKWKSAQVLIRTLADVASKGGNFLLNVGPDGAGVIPAPSVERLKAVGQWLEVNGEAIYGTTASPLPKRPFWGRYTLRRGAKGRDTLYVHVFNWPRDGQLEVPGLTQMPKRARILGIVERTSLPSPVAVTLFKGGLGLNLPAKMPNPDDTVIALDFNGPLPLRLEPEPAAGDGAGNTAPPPNPAP